MGVSRVTQFIHIEVPESLLQRLIDRSQAEGITLNELCLRLLNAVPLPAVRPLWPEGLEVDGSTLRPGDTP